MSLMYVDDECLNKSLNNQRLTFPAFDYLQERGLSQASHIIKPLLVSADIPIKAGELSLFSTHQQTINLINDDQQLITIHRYNSGLSPMGIVLKSSDFDYVLSLVSDLSIYQSATGDLQVGIFFISLDTHVCQLNIKKHSLANKSQIANLLKEIETPTGLFGKLSDNLSGQYQLELLCNTMTNLMNGKADDITPFIGLGPGLTPSFDDIIVGMLAVISSDCRFDNQIRQLKFAFERLSLHLLTTTVSASFLTYALQGKFSLLVLQVINSFAQHKYHHSSIKNLSNYGHTSGSDLLLGIWLGIDRFVLRD